MSTYGTAFSGFGNGFASSNKFSPEALFKFTNLDARVQKHLARVYATLAWASLLVAFGCYLQISMIAVPGILCQLAALGCLFGLSITRNDARNLNTRYALLSGFSLCQGVAIGPLVGMAMFVAPAALVTAFLATSAIFISFSLSALITKRRSYMYLGGYLAAATTGMLVMQLGRLFMGPSALVYGVQLYGGLLMFSAYILYDTQLIVERASAGNMDHIMDALNLLVNIIAIFVRILIILLKRAEEERRKEEARKRRK